MAIGVDDILSYKKFAKLNYYFITAMSLIKVESILQIMQLHRLTKSVLELEYYITFKRSLKKLKIKYILKLMYVSFGILSY